jgi:AcrR family transcriptional regulator
MPVKASRRERVRDATVLEIKGTARRLLVADGPEALTLRAIAREMGMTAPALYRYFASHEELVGAVAVDLLAELTATLEEARDTVGLEDPVGRLGAACRAFRRWALGHPREFQLVFASPTGDLAGVGGAPSLEAPRDRGAEPEATTGGDLATADLSFGGVFLQIFVEIWQAQPFDIPSNDQLPPSLVRQLTAFSAAVGDVLPLGALAAYLAGWVRLYGSVTIETFGHLGFALDDAEPMFEAMLADMARALRG